MIASRKQTQACQRRLSFDPDAKPQTHYRTRTFRRRVFGVVLGLFVSCFLAIGLGAAVWPKSSSRYAKIKDALRKQHPDIDFSGPDGYKEALEWISVDDPLQLGITDSSLAQRFLLAATFFATQTENKPWSYCEQVTLGDDEVCISPSQIRGIRWLTGHSECMWFGVKCEGGIVTVINVDNLGLHGFFPRALTGLVGLIAVDLSQNALFGTIPSSFFSLPLVGIRLDGNNLSGAIDGFKRFTELIHMDVSKNRFSGTIPNLAAETIEEISLSFNKFTGTVPSALGNMQQLEAIKFGHNALEGSIPSSIGLLQRLQRLELQHNAIDGTIPGSMYFCKELQHVNLSGNQLHGKLDSQIWSLPKLRAVYLSGNSFSGTLPNNKALLAPLRFISISGNRFSGTFPENLCLNKALTSVEPDCSQRSIINENVLVCDCCSSCCSNGYDQCL